MKNIVKVFVALMLMLFSVTLVENVNVSDVQAAKVRWHKGMPKSLRGNWYSRGMILKISNKYVYFVPVGGAAVSKVKKLTYRKHGKNTYQYRIVWSGNSKYIGTIKKLNKHTVKFNGYTLKK